MVMEIPLTKGYTALVDDEDYEWIIQYKWYAIPNNSGKIYAMRTFSNGRSFMHRAILERQGIDMEGLDADHKDRNSLNNQRSNLRPATKSQNLVNQVARNQTGYKGLSWMASRERYLIQCPSTGRNRVIGALKNKHYAAQVYNAYMKYHFGEFAYLNEIPAEHRLTLREIYTIEESKPSKYVQPLIEIERVNETAFTPSRDELREVQLPLDLPPAAHSETEIA